MKVILSCAGTGGHIYPAIAIADKIMKEDPSSEILFIGTKKGMENRLVPEAGYEIRGIDASGFNRKQLHKNVKTLADMIKGGAAVRKILKDFKPDAVIGTGGYVTGTVLSNASKAGIPCFIHEQNVIPGMANKMLEKYSEKVFISFEESRKYFKKADALVYSGNPIRSAFLDADKSNAKAEIGLAEDDFMILATGGSLGAEKLNYGVMELISSLQAKGSKAKVVFVTGKMYYEEIKGKLEESGCGIDRVILKDYASNMPVLMAAADLIISRAGAIALSEITVSGKPCVLIPSPNVTNNHQYWNAKALADCGAALLIEEKDLKDSFAPFTDAVAQLIENKGALAEMAEKSTQAGKTDAVDIIYKNLKI
ncbi:MAG: undecaprenyldiphospho-muramoylpentapeptide beta-N-acetylglucosaminyltransferase [Clostridia bacterium]|nr:undecaprenyldiphospho-muramoylpentapeptide beta-N-acetylglucosaminyltransferase [Clostridia bacterium]